MSITKFIFRRLLFLIPTLLGITMITFFISHVVPGDPARLIAGLEAKEEAVERIRQELGLDKPVHIQYLLYMSGLMRGDLGKSVINRKPVIENLLDYFPATVELALIAFTLAVLAGIPIGMYTAIHKDGWGDTIFRFISMLGIAFPIFWVGIILLLIFYFKLGWLPSSGRVDVELFASQNIKVVTNLLLVDSILARNPAIFWDSLKHLILPAVTLAFGPMARFTRFTRAVMLEVLAMPYIQTARAKGSKESRVIMRHALRNALIPTTTLMGIAFGYMLGGSVLVEMIFGWPGIGKYAFESITFLDYPAIVGITLLSATIFLMVNLFVDFLYGILDPRIEYS